MKIVINQCHGGFGLSDAGMVAYGERKGIKVYPDSRSGRYTVYWTIPIEDLPPYLYADKLTVEQRAARSKAWADFSLNDRSIERNDPDLVAVVEQLGNAASGRYAKLKVVEIPDGVEWKIEECDGMEHVAEVHRTWS